MVRSILRATGLSIAALSFTALPAHAGFERECDCLDDDGDGAIDEFLDCQYPLEVEATADDAYWLGMDGVNIGGNGNWQQATIHNAPVRAGHHVLSVRARDTQLVAQGFKAEVRSPLMATQRTGTGFWRMQSTVPVDPNWMINANGLFTPDNLHLCPGAVWGNIPASLVAADWVWADGCDPDTDPRMNFGVAEFEICPDATVCCALDDGTTINVTATECEDRGGQQTFADLCVDVCCALRDGTTITTTVGSCDAQGGQVVPDEMCIEEDCNCEDDDGDGLIDEGVDCEYEGELLITADDAYDAWLNENDYLGGNGTWSQASSYPFAVPPGFHTIAVEARDVQFSLQGLIARVFPPFAPSYDTGAGLWQLSSIIPAGTAWRSTGAGLNVNDSAAICANQAGWGGQPAALNGADWVWAGGCDPDIDPRQNAAYTRFEACIEAWVCCLLEDGTVAQTNAIECEFNGQIVSWDACQEKPCDPIECPPGETPVDTDGDGCDDACKVIDLKVGKALRR